MEWQINPANAFIIANLTELNPTREAYLRHFERTADGVWIDKIIYSMTRPELADTLKRLEAKLLV